MRAHRYVISLSSHNYFYLISFTFIIIIMITVTNIEFVRSIRYQKMVKEGIVLFSDQFSLVGDDRFWLPFFLWSVVISIKQNVCFEFCFQSFLFILLLQFF